MKTYKGIELIEAISNGELKDGTKLRCVNSNVYSQGVEVDKALLVWSDTKTQVRYYHFNDKDFEFEIIEDNPKYIEEIEFYKITDTTLSGLVDTMNVICQDFIATMNRLSKAVNYLLDNSKGEK